jgi:hypothetical protein
MNWILGGLVYVLTLLLLLSMILRRRANEDFELKPLEGCTCTKCPHRAGCQFAFDVYNYKGNCRASV